MHATGASPARAKRHYDSVNSDTLATPRLKATAIGSDTCLKFQTGIPRREPPVLLSAETAHPPTIAFAHRTVPKPASASATLASPK
jgi:hypothetical protein